MKSPKLILLGGVAALTATVVIAQLTPEQRRAADEALRQKMEELNSGGKPAKAAKPAPAPAPVVKSAPAPAAPVVVGAPAKGLTPEQEAAARAALAAALAAPAATPVVVVGAPSKGLTPEQRAAAEKALAAAMAGQASQTAQTIQPAQPVTPPVVVNTKDTRPAVIVATKGLTPEQEAAAREALVIKMAELNARDGKAATTTTPQVVVAQPGTKAIAAVAEPGDTAAQAKARAALRGGIATLSAGGKPMPDGLPITQAQWDQIVALTILYKADRITPTEYHAKRAAIISEGSTGGGQ